MSKSDFWPPQPPQPPARPPRADEAGYELEPVQAESPAPVCQRPGELPDDDEPAGRPDRGPDWDHGFSLRQLLALMVVASAMLAVMRLFSPAVAAGLAGLAVLAGLVILSMGDPPAIVRLTWWMLLAIYLTAALVAVARG